MKIIILPGAQADLLEAAAFYDEQEGGLGIQVYQFLENEIDQLDGLAGSHPIRFNHHRKVVRGRFPYFCIYYKLQGDTVFVNAVTD